MDEESIQELAALDALHALDGVEASQFEQLRGRDVTLEAEVERFRTLALAIRRARSPRTAAPPHLKERILQKIRATSSASGPALVDLPGFTFISKHDAGGWQQLPVPGASVKLLSVDPERGYAVVLGKLEAGTRYPSHRHLKAEEIFILSGDLHIAGRKLEAGDFHRAGAGTTHGENYSEAGCMILAVISTDDLQAQFAP
jgi:hypothetical protein